MATKFGRMVNYLKVAPTYGIVQPFDLAISCNLNDISTTTVTMTTKLDRMVIYQYWHLPIKSHDLLIT